MADAYNVQLHEKKGSIVVNSSGNNYTISGNIEMFQVTIGNLIDNAIRYNKNAPQININLESGKDTLVINITDNGIGINKENLPQIFEKFYRIPTGDIHENEGFGLGLYFVKNTIKQMNGKMRISSQINKGTTFTIEFPFPKR